MVVQIINANSVYGSNNSLINGLLVSKSKKSYAAVVSSISVILRISSV